MARKKQETLVLFQDIEDYATKLTDIQLGQLMRAVLGYRFHDLDYSGDDPLVDLAFAVVKSQINRYREISETNSKNARQPAKSSESQRNSAESSESQRSDPPNQTKPYQTNPNVYPLVECEIVDGPPKRPPQKVSPIIDSPSDFETFWKSYPKKVGKTAAQRAFAKVQAPLSVLLDALERQKASQQWQRDGGQYIPNPSTWLNQGRWEDEVSEVGVVQSQNSRASYVPPNNCPGNWMEV